MDGEGITAVVAKDFPRQDFSQVDLVVLAGAEDFTAQDWQSIVVSIPEESLVLIAEGEGMIAESFFEKLKNSEEFASLFVAQKAIVPHLPQRCEAGRERMTDQMVAG